MARELLQQSAAVIASQNWPKSAAYGQILPVTVQEKERARSSSFLAGRFHLFKQTERRLADRERIRAPALSSAATICSLALFIPRWLAESDWSGDTTRPGTVAR
jgi:hypothetical protein